MKKIFIVLFSFCAMTGWTQQPLLTTRWTQEYPYNQHCPADPLENNEHSYTGCPATAMGQILNYLQTTQGTRFDDGDFPAAERDAGFRRCQIPAWRGTGRLVDGRRGFCLWRGLQAGLFCVGFIRFRHLFRESGVRGLSAFRV